MNERKKTQERVKKHRAQKEEKREQEVQQQEEEEKAKTNDVAVRIVANLRARLDKYRGTVAPRNTGRQGTNKFYLLLADFRYCQYRK